MAAVKNSADRQKIHELLRTHTLKAWESLKNGDPNPLAEALQSDPVLLNYLSQGEIAALMDATSHTGIAESRARSLAKHQSTLEDWLGRNSP